MYRVCYVCMFVCVCMTASVHVCVCVCMNKTTTDEKKGHEFERARRDKWESLEGGKRGKMQL